MVIDNFDIFRTCIRPSKTNPPLIVYADTVLTGTIVLKRLKMIAGWHL